MGEHPHCSYVLLLICGGLRWTFGLGNAKIQDKSSRTTQHPLFPPEVFLRVYVYQKPYATPAS